MSRLHRIRELLAEGLNLAGIAQVVALEEQVETLRAEITRLRRPESPRPAEREAP